jgi:hypothetical protein
MAVDQWPETDRRLWRAACAAADILDDGFGVRSQHADISNRKAAKGYGRWLTHLSLSTPETLDEAPAARITEDRVRGYVDALTLIGNRARRSSPGCRSSARSRR